MQYEFIESSIFTKMVHDYLSDEDYAAFQQFLLEHPDAGDVVCGSGGVRKVRWGWQVERRSGLLLHTQPTWADSAVGDLCQKCACQHSWRIVETNQRGARP